MVTFPILDFFSHLETEPIAIQILRRILIQEAVPVAVMRPDCAPVHLSCVQIELGSIRIIFRLDIKSFGINKRGNLGISPIIGQYMPGKIESRFCTCDFTRVPVSLQKHGRLVCIFACGLIGNGYLPDISPLKALTNRVKLNQIWIFFFPFLQKRNDFSVFVVMVKIHLTFNFGSRLWIINVREKARSMSCPSNCIYLRLFYFFSKNI